MSSLCQCLWGLSPQTATTAILRVLAVLLHTQDMLDPSFLLPSPPEKGTSRWPTFFHHTAQFVCHCITLGVMAPEEMDD